MQKRFSMLALVAAAWALGAHGALAQPNTVDEPFLLGPPSGDGPVLVQASFQLRDINEIDDAAETFELGGVLELTWRDDRRAFDPVTAGVREKVYQGDFQFAEVSTGWFPQIVL
ncbi:MAG: hypothetical protein ACN4G0_10660, partial [Polyangiales bacterium]